MWWQMELVFSLTVFILWNIIRTLYNACRFVSWCLTGTRKQVLETYKDSSYQEPVQVLKILLRHKFDVLHEPAGVHNFIACHEGFVTADYVLKDQVTLYYITSTEAIFVDSDIDNDVTNSDNGSFLRQAQFNLANKMLIMPIHVFLKLGGLVGKPKATLVFLPNVGRCGSTIVTQVFEQVENTVALSEPDSLNAMMQVKTVVSEEEFRQILSCCVNLICKPVLNREVKTFVLKPSELTMALVPDILDLFPDSLCVFIYRNPLATARSLSRICYTAPLLQLMMLLWQLSPKLAKFTFDFPSKPFDRKLVSRLHFGILVWAYAVEMYLDFRDSGMNIIAIRYEDFVEDRQYVFQKVFEFCNLPYNAATIDKAISRDSERGTSISQERTQKYRSWVDEYTDYVKEHADKACDDCNVPRIDDYQVLPGTVSCKNQRP